MIKKFVVMCAMSFCVPLCFAAGVWDLSEHLKRWGESMGKEVKVDLPYNPQIFFTQRMAPKTEHQFNTQIDFFNTILKNQNIPQIQACMYPDSIVVIPVDGACTNNR